MMTGTMISQNSNTDPTTIFKEKLNNMKRHLWIAALASILAFSPAITGSYIYAEETGTDFQEDTGQDAEQQFDQDQGQWITDEPAGMDDSEGSDAYDPATDDNQEPTD